jgi:hypothetical protein
VTPSPTGAWATACQEAITLDESSQPSDVEQLREQFPDWSIEARWTVAGTGPDSRYLLASRGGVTVSAWTSEDLAAEIRRKTGAS